MNGPGLDFTRLLRYLGATLVAKAFGLPQSRVAAASRPALATRQAILSEGGATVLTDAFGTDSHGQAVGAPWTS